MSYVWHRIVRRRGIALASGIAMDSPSEPSIDELWAGRRIEDYDTFSIVTVPGSTNLTQKRRAELIEKLKEDDIARSSPLSSAELFSRLRDLTPPLDSEVEDEESRMLERDARTTLQAAGCPPCYPSDLQVPLRDVPREYEPIISYWKSFPGTGDVVLRAQLSDWKRFCAFQAAMRRKYKNRPLDFWHYVSEVREQRRIHGLGGEVRLEWCEDGQSQVQNWIEFQHYHLRLQNGLLKQKAKMKMELAEAQRQVKYNPTLKAKNNENAYKGRLAYAQENLEDHEILLQWSEQQRLAMTASQWTTSEDGINHLDDTSRPATGESLETARTPGNKFWSEKKMSKSKRSSQVQKYSKTKQPVALTPEDEPDLARSRSLKLRRLNNRLPTRQYLDRCALKTRSGNTYRRAQK